MFFKVQFLNSYWSKTHTVFIIVLNIVLNISVNYKIDIIYILAIKYLVLLRFISCMEREDYFNLNLFISALK